jgi:Ca2+-binding RTX toxin-like protein
MGTFTYALEANLYKPWNLQFDPSSITRQGLPGGFILWFGQLTDGNTFWMHEKAGQIVSLTVSDGSVDLVSATLALPSAPLLAWYNASNFSGAKWANYLMSGSDVITGSIGNDKLFGGDGDDWLRGDAGNDALQGAAGNDTLAGGVGKDRLNGGAGADSFVFDTAASKTNVDRVSDFVHLQDTLVFDSAVFSALTLGLLDPAGFSLGTLATTADQHLIYDQTSGSLWYDADGAGGAAQQLVATLTNHAALAAADILVL